MSKHEKILARMWNNPRDWKIEELISIATHYEIEVRSDGGSHHVFSHPLVPLTICVPAHRPIKPVYIRQFLSLIEQIEGVTL